MLILMIIRAQYLQNDVSQRLDNGWGYQTRPRDMRIVLRPFAQRKPGTQNSLYG